MLQEAEAPKILDNRHMKVASLSAPRTGRLYLTGDISGTYFSRGLVGNRATVRPEGLRQCKIPMSPNGRWNSLPFV